MKTLSDGRYAVIPEEVPRSEGHCREQRLRRPPSADESTFLGAHEIKKVIGADRFLP